jgi:CheY-like chemotaxis protein
VLFEQILFDAGYVVAGPFANSDDALSFLGAGTVDAALLDINLGGGDWAYPVAVQLAARQIPFAFVTAYLERQVDPRFRDRPLLYKPCRVEEIEETLQGLVAKS